MRINCMHIRVLVFEDVFGVFTSSVFWAASGKGSRRCPNFNSALKLQRRPSDALKTSSARAKLAKKNRRPAAEQATFFGCDQSLTVKCDKGFTVKNII